MGGGVDPAFFLGAGVLPAATRQGQSHQAAVRALAFTWIRILSRCWQERTPYDEAVYLQALHRRGASLIHTLAKVS
jgi:hypothetical protein